VIYFTGNSLGLQPKRTKAYVDEVMNDWANLAVEGHFTVKTMVGLSRTAKPLSKKLGALPSEVTVMNTLTVNLHLLMVSFYQPTKLDIKKFARRKHFFGSIHVSESSRFSFA
jgi:kynureninase